MMIWNPDFDLGTNSKDIPCNDCVMMKIRNGRLYTTIQNRSNDLHWGLPTNIFQFGFLSEVLANVLGVSLGTQTHNSQSLHIYDWNDIATRMDNELYFGNAQTLYDIEDVREIAMDFKFSHEVPSNRLCEVSIMFERIIANLSKVAEGIDTNLNELDDVLSQSYWFAHVYRLLEIYLLYKRGIAKEGITDEEKQEEAVLALQAIQESLSGDEFEGWDIGVLAMNFFANKIKNFHSEIPMLGKL